MQQNAMQFTATQFGSEDEEARICLKSSTVTATTTTTTVVSSTAPFLSFPYGPHPPPRPQPTSLPSVFQQPSIPAADAAI